MATYVNDLRLKEIATGDESGTWGTSTNTNLSLIADAFGLGTKQLAADADETFTIPDTTADGARALYLKLTSAVSLTATRTVTLGPNTVSKVWIIENATTGSQIITIAQGSGATINVPSGSKLIVVTDGAGAGAAVFNANPTEIGGSVTSVAGTGTVNGITLTGTVTSTGSLTLGGTLGNVDLTSQVTGTLPVGNGGTGITALGTGVATALGINVGSAGAPVVFDGALGTPSSGTLTNASGLPAAGVVGIAAILGANTFTAAQEWATGSSVASASTINLDTATGNRVHVTGTTTITAVTLTRGPRTVVFDGILTLTHHATTNNLPGAANITTAAGDRAIYESDGTAVYCVSYTKASGLATVVGAATVTVVRSARTSNTILGTADQGTLIDITSGTFTQTFTAAATLGTGWFAYVRNSGTGDITLDPNASETIDGLTSYIMYSGETRLVQCDGSNFTSLVLSPFSTTFTASGTFTKPPGYSYFGGIGWGAGGAGGKGASSRGAGGGGGAAGIGFILKASALSATETVTIAAATAGPTTGVAGPQGGTTSLGTLAYSYGGGGGTGGSSSNNSGGGGGGALSAGTTGTGTSSPAGGSPLGIAATANSGFGGGAGGYSSSLPGYLSYAGGGGGGSNSSGGGGAGGSSAYGGGGGGGSTDTGGSGGDGAGGVSTYGGSGGAAGFNVSGTDGTAPGGGGGGTTTNGTKAGDGARGELRIWGAV